MLSCQRRWGEDTGKHYWAKRLIPDISAWVERKRGELSYGLTQLPTRHGCTGEYLKRFKLQSTDVCWYCGETDTGEHTFFRCERWAPDRAMVETNIGEQLNPDRLVMHMLQREQRWRDVYSYAGKVVPVTEADERDRKKEAAVRNPTN